MTEPDYIAQTAEPKTDKQRRKWFDEALKRRLTWARKSAHPTQNALLFEAWAERPADEGEPRWQLEAA